MKDSCSRIMIVTDNKSPDEPIRLLGDLENFVKNIGIGFAQNHATKIVKLKHHNISFFWSRQSTNEGHARSSAALWT